MKHQQLPLGPRDLVAALSTPEQQAFEFNRASLEQWLNDHHGHAREERDFGALVDVLNPVFDYLAGATDPNNTAMRVWCLLYVVRPDLIEFESFNTAGMRFGVSDESLRVYLKRLLAVLPAYRFVPRPSVGPNSLEHRRRVQRRAELRKRGAVLDNSPEVFSRTIEELRAS
jgi:hypothetical protein